MRLIRIRIGMISECINEYDEDGRPVSGKFVRIEWIKESHLMYRRPERALRSSDSEELI